MKRPPVLKQSTLEASKQGSKRVPLLIQNDDGTTDAALTQSFAKMEHVALNDVLTDKAAAEEENAIPVGSWFTSYTSFDITSESMWSAHSTILVFLFMIYANI